MGKNSGIEWTEHTFNPWWGCTRVSAGCTYCYAETWAGRSGQKGIWGPRAGRRFFKPGHFGDPMRWQKAAAEAGRYDRVMCGSMCDIFEIHEDPEVADQMLAARRRVWDLVELTPNLIWILTTKRPEVARSLVPRDWWAEWPANVWIMVTMETQAMADLRMPMLEAIPAAVRAVSAEPLVGAIDPRAFRCGYCHGSGLVSTGRAMQTLLPCPTCEGRGVSIDWVVVGGETGGKARPMDPAWVRELRDFAVAYDTPFFFKQWGEWAPSGYSASEGYRTGGRTFKHEGSDEIMVRLGKKKTGMRLDGRTWKQTPKLEPGYWRGTPNPV